MKDRCGIKAVNSALLRRGVVLLPTETVYGLAANAQDHEAVNKLYRVKGRNFNKPIAISIKQAANAGALVTWCDTAQKLADAFWPGPLSLVLPAKSGVQLDTRLFGQFKDGTPSLSLRVPQSQWRKDIGPDYLALTSANKSGQDDITDFDQALAMFDGEIDAALDGNIPAYGIASTIIAIQNQVCRILRHGALKPADFAPLDLEWSAQ